MQNKKKERIPKIEHLFTSSPQELKKNKKIKKKKKLTPRTHLGQQHQFPTPVKSDDLLRHCTVSSADQKSGEKKGAFVSVSPKKNPRGVMQKVTSTTAYPFQANRFAISDV